MRGAVEWVFLLAAGLLAGVIGTAGGITSLVSYPALLAVGISPLAANVTNSVSVLGSGFSSALRAGPDVEGHAQVLRRWLVPTAVLSFGGAVLLVATPGAVFDRIVPFLVAAASVVLLLQPLIARWQKRRGARLHGPALAASGAGVALYNGYFGAGSGILLIALLLLSREPVLHRANAMKNVIIALCDVAPAVLFAALGTVVWSAAIPVGLGAVGGGLIGPVIARRVPTVVLRIAIGSCGFALAGYLLVA